MAHNLAKISSITLYRSNYSTSTVSIDDLDSVEAE